MLCFYHAFSYCIINTCMLDNTTKLLSCSFRFTSFLLKTTIPEHHWLAKVDLSLTMVLPYYICAACLVISAGLVLFTILFFYVNSMWEGHSSNIFPLVSSLCVVCIGPSRHTHYSPQQAPLGWLAARNCLWVQKSWVVSFCFSACWLTGNLFRLNPASCLISNPLLCLQAKSCWEVNQPMRHERQ